MSKPEPDDPVELSRAGLLDLIHDGLMTQAVCVAAELGVADLLDDTGRHIDALADATGCHAESLHRLMRALASLGLCAEQESGSFTITPSGSLLRTNSPDSVRSWARFCGTHQWPVWGQLLYSVRTGSSARQRLLGTQSFAHLTRNAETATLFHEAMAEHTRLVATQVVQAYDFGSVRRLVDIGGGHAELLIQALKAHPQMHGTVFDLPHAEPGATRALEDAGVANRGHFCAGDFFQAVPTAADLYLLKSILHDWDDEHSVKILSCCRHAMPPDARVLLVERIMPERVQALHTHKAVVRADLSMLVGPGGRERTEAQYAALFDAAGLRLVRIAPAGFGYSCVEAAAARDC
jgi:hypothetical protein